MSSFSGEGVNLAMRDATDPAFALSDNQRHDAPSNVWLVVSPN
jgi:2-polyprenyl-6-methoxyphenol hydroxylase-like FAD-dependent oxidoreductase